MSRKAYPRTKDRIRQMDAKALRNMPAHEADFLYLQDGCIEGERLTISKLGNMLCDLLELEKRKPGVDSKKGVFVVNVILNFMKRELMAGRSVQLPYMGAIWLKTIQPSSNPKMQKYRGMLRKGKAYVRRKRIEPQFRLANKMIEALQVDTF